MSAQLKTSGVATACTMCLAPHPETGVVTEFVSSVVNGIMTVGSNITGGTLTWKGLTRKCASLPSVAYNATVSLANHISFGSDTTLMARIQATPALTIIAIVRVSGPFAWFEGITANNAFSSRDAISGGNTTPQLRTTAVIPTTSGAALAATNRVMVGFCIDRTASTTAFVGLESASALTYQTGLATFPGAGGEIDWPTYHYGRLWDTPEQVAHDLIVYLKFNRVLTNTELAAIFADWQGTLLDVATPATALQVSGPSSGMAGVASSAITVTANGVLSASKTVAGSDGAGGTVTFVGGNTLASGGSVTATYTPGSVGAKTVTFTVTDASLTAGTLSYTATGATALQVSGPSSGQTGVASGAITVTANGLLAASKTITGSDGAGGTVAFVGGTTLASGGSVTATYTPNSAGAKTVTFATSDSSLTAAQLSYTATAAAARLLFTSTVTDVCRVLGSGAVMANATAAVHIHHASAGTLIAQLSVTTDGSGLFGTVQSGAMALSTLYRVDYKFPSGEYGVVYRTSEPT